MIVTVQGYNGKKSKSAQTACIVAGMLALKENSNTLLLQCINHDINSVENILYGKDMSKKFGANETDFADNGIDALLRSVGSTRVGSEDFEKYCTSLTTVKNRLDITECSKTNIFEQTVLTMEEELANVLTGAKDIYDNVIILGPCDEPDTTEMLNKYADLSIYCITQGHKATGKAFGKNIYYLVTDFEDTSSINLSVIKKEYHTGGMFSKNNVLKLSRNVAVRDAAITGTLLRYIRDNRECSQYEAHYEWYKDVAKIISLINQNAEEESDYSWELQEYGTYEYGLLDSKAKEDISSRQALTVIDVPEKKEGFLKRLFGFGKGKPLHNSIHEDIPVENFDFEEAATEDETNTVDISHESVQQSEIDGDQMADEIVDDIAQEMEMEDGEFVLDPEHQTKKTQVVKKTPVKKTPAKKASTTKKTTTSSETPKKATSSTTKKAKTAATKTSSTATARKTTRSTKKVSDEAETAESEKPVVKKVAATKTTAPKKTVKKVEDTSQVSKATKARSAASTAKVSAKVSETKDSESLEPKTVASKPKKVVKATAPKAKKTSKPVAEEAV